MMLIRLVEERELIAVSELFSLCHPEAAGRDSRWFKVHPTLVAIGYYGTTSIDLSSKIIGSTSFTIAPTTAGYIAYLMDTSVHPDYRRRGIGSKLFAARQQLLEQFGVRHFFGMAAPSNERMNLLLSKHGFIAGETLPEGYPDGPAVVWEKKLA